MELYRKYRPTSLSELVGQPQAVNTLQALIDEKHIPHAILLGGPSGCGKTTIARILKRKLKCGDHPANFKELNCADFTGIDQIRKIRRDMRYVPLGKAKARAWLIDECHQLSGDAQHAFLKLLEDPPSYVYFILATTFPEKMDKMIRTRCTEINVNLVEVKEMEALVIEVATKEGKTLTEDVRDEIVKAAMGSPRKALVILDQIIGLDSEAKQLGAIQNVESQAEAVEIWKCLINTRSRWADMIPILKKVKGEPEGLRHYILACASNTLLAGGKAADKALLIIKCFQYNFFDSKKAGLISACYDVLK